MSRRRLWLPGMAALLALTACGQEPAGKFNVVLISIDSLRADRTGPYGHRPEFAPALDVTPNLDRLAQSGTVFEDAWSSSSWTLASHMALMTGLTDRGHEVEFDDFALDPLRATLAEQFRAAGYATGGYFSGSFLEPQYGFGRGFQHRAFFSREAEANVGAGKREALHDFDDRRGFGAFGLQEL